MKFQKQEITNSLKSIKPIVKDGLIIRANVSNNQIKKGLVVNQKELEAQSKNW
jgi:hypothetical protein